MFFIIFIIVRYNCFVFIVLVDEFNDVVVIFDYFVFENFRYILYNFFNMYKILNIFFKNIFLMKLNVIIIKR